MSDRKWKQGDLFEGRRLRDEGIDRAVESAGQRLLDVGRGCCVRAALKRESRTATADDAHYGMIAMGYEPGILGNAAGALFKEKTKWELVGKEPSQRASRHSNENRIWRYIGEFGP